MRKKVSGLLIVSLLSMFLLAGFSVAQETEKIDSAHSCLYNKIEDTTLTLEEAVFSALAGIPQSKINNKINSEKSASVTCWPKSGCTVKATAQALLAKQKLGENTDDVADWLLNQTGPVPDITWYLQIIIDDNGAGNCTVNYDETNHDIKIDSNMKLSGSPGACLSIVDGNYRLRVSANCIEKEFSVKCEEKSFKSNLLYRKGADGTIYVSPNTHPASGGQWAAPEKITAKCFKQGGACSYEDSLWASSALYASQKDVSYFIPYLTVLASSNERYFPNAFLEFVDTGSHYSGIIESRKNDDPAGTYWHMASSPFTKFYDTSLAMLALGGKDDAEISGNTFPYLFSVQDESGCWGGNSIIDTAFIIYSAKWGKSLSGGGSGDGCNGNAECGEDEVCRDSVCVAVDGNETCAEAGGDCVTSCVGSEREVNASCSDSESVCCVGSGGGGGSSPTACSLAGYHCAPDSFSCLEAYGEVKSNNDFYCDTFVEACCTVEVAIPLENCFAIGGSVCNANQECSGSILQASDGACCTDLCVDLGGENEPDCEYDDDCDSDEECSNGLCILVSKPSDSGGGSSWVWIIILVVLIALMVLGIIFKDKVRVWWFKVTGKAKTSNVGGPKAPPGFAGTGPRFGPRGGPPGARPRFMPGRGPPMSRARSAPPRAPPGRSMPPRAAPNNKEMDETLKKLKDMSK